MAGKTWTTFAPMGPVDGDLGELTDPHNLGIRCVLNGEVMQNSSTAQFIFNIPQANRVTVADHHAGAGDCVFTGTPPGVGLLESIRLPKDGDIAEIQSTASALAQPGQQDGLTHVNRGGRVGPFLAALIASIGVQMVKRHRWKWSTSKGAKSRPLASGATRRVAAW